jgi:NADH-ubiquinone oxidoreductase chain 5
LIKLRIKYKVFYEIYKFLIHKWYFDFIQNDLIGHGVLYSSYHILFKILDKGFVELLGPAGITSTLFKMAGLVKKMQAGYIYEYTCCILFFVILMLTTLEMFS